MIDDKAGFDNDLYKQLPIYLKAEEIHELIERMLFGFGSEELKQDNSIKGIDLEMISEFFNYSKSLMLANSLMIPAKIADAESGNIYDLRMENATIIRKAAKELIIDAQDLQNNGFKDIEYLDLLRLEIERFRVLFVQWVAHFDTLNYILDRWGLFNPPGITYSEDDDTDK